MHNQLSIKTMSTKEVARLAGIHWMTLYRWLKQGKVRPSIAIKLKGRTLHRWTAEDVERVRQYKQKNYRKGRGRKPAKKDKRNGKRK
jgi:excisionase family DNA binding protein